MILNIMPFHLHTASTALDILRSNLILRVNIEKTDFVLQCGTRSTLLKKIICFLRLVNFIITFL